MTKNGSEIEVETHLAAAVADVHMLVFAGPKSQRSWFGAVPTMRGLKVGAGDDGGRDLVGKGTLGQRLRRGLLACPTQKRHLSRREWECSD